MERLELKPDLTYLISKILGFVSFLFLSVLSCVVMSCSVCSIGHLRNCVRDTPALSQIAPRLAVMWASEWLDHDEPQRDGVNSMTETSRPEASAVS